jgi:uncharacterized membrane protein (GlpM family)
MVALIPLFICFALLVCLVWAICVEERAEGTRRAVVCMMNKIQKYFRSTEAFL